MSETAIPKLKTLIDPLTVRFKAAWDKACRPGDDGEFNARVCSVLYYEHGMTAVGRNGKRGDPTNLSNDIINWKATAGMVGPNPDPTRVGGTGWIIDFIPNHESLAARIDQFYPDPTGPGAWVTPLRMDEIDVLYGHAPARPLPVPTSPGAPPPAFRPYEALGGDGAGMAISRVMAFDYMRANGRGLDRGCGSWMFRSCFVLVTGEDNILTAEQAIAKYRPEWCAQLGVPVIPVPDDF